MGKCVKEWRFKRRFITVLKSILQFGSIHKMCRTVGDEDEEIRLRCFGRENQALESERYKKVREYMLGCGKRTGQDEDADRHEFLVMKE